jgi:hypothetical protein
LHFVWRDASGEYVPVTPAATYGSKTLFNALITENIEENERKFAALKELLPKISVHSIEILQDNKAEFECKIHLHPGQIDPGAQLFNAGRMIIAFETDTHHGGCAWGVSVLTTTRVNDTCTLHLYFDLEAEEKFSRTSFASI